MSSTWHTQPKARQVLVGLWLWIGFVGLLMYLATGIGHRYDLWCNLGWFERVNRLGVAETFRTWYQQQPIFNYPPFILYCYRILGTLFPADWIVHGGIKWPALFFDGLSTIVLAWWALRLKRPWLAALALGLNAGLLYNSWAWGQMDSIHSCWILLALLALAYEKPAWAAAAWVLALNMKIQSVVFLPPLAVAIAWQCGANRSRWLNTLVLAAGTQLLLVAPLLRHGVLNAYKSIVVESVDYGPNVSYNAFNHWYFWVGDPRNTHDHSVQLLGLHAKHWGLLLLSLNVALILLPYCWRLYQRWRNGDGKALQADDLLAYALLCFAFFYFPTQMHERYIHPAIVLAGAWVVLARPRQWPWYLLLSMAYLGSLHQIGVQASALNLGLPTLPPKTYALVFGLLYGYGLAVWYRVLK